MDEIRGQLNQAPAEAPDAVKAEPAPTGGAREVVLEYVRRPQPVVEYYVHSEPYPGRDARQDGQNAPAELTETRGKRRKARGIAMGVGVIVLIALGLGLLRAWLSSASEPGDPFDFPWSDAYEKVYTAADTKITPYPNGDGTRLRIVEEHGDALSIQEIYQRVNPSTVTVVTSLGDGGGLVGTGVLFTRDGYILTNAHVIAGGKECVVVLSTGQHYRAALLGMDDVQDLAVIKVNGTDLPVAEFGDSDALHVGDPVYAIGNPLGVELRGTLTNGIVSAINRDVEVDDVVMTLIQTNAALNNGNSGGPLINQYGQVVGINTMKMGSTSTTSVEGLGFAIPISATSYMVNDLIACGKVRGEPVIGISVQPEGYELIDGRVGVLIVELLDPDGPGAQAGLLPGDVILAADGEPLSSSADLLRVRRRHIAGEALQLSVWRESGGVFETEVVLAEAKE